MVTTMGVGQLPRNGIVEDPASGIRHLAQAGKFYNLFSLPNLNGKTELGKDFHVFDLDAATPCRQDLLWYAQWKNDPLVKFLLPTPKQPMSNAAVLVTDKEIKTLRMILCLLDLQSVVNKRGMISPITQKLEIDLKSNLLTKVVYSVKTADSSYVGELIKESITHDSKLLFVTSSPDLVIPKEEVDEITTELTLTQLPSNLRAIGNYHVKRYLKGEENADDYKPGNTGYGDFTDYYTSDGGSWTDAGDPKTFKKLPDLR